MRNFLSALLVVGSFFMASAQNISVVRSNIEKLSSKSFAGRGYVKNGDRKAAKFIAKKFKKYGLQEINDSYFQTYSFSINTFPKKLSLQVNETILVPGLDFVIKSSAAPTSGSFPCLYLPLSDNQKELDLSKYFLVGNKEFKELSKVNLFAAKGFLFLEEKQPIWSVYAGRDTSSYLVFNIDNRKLKDSIQYININIESEYKSAHQTQNVWGLVKGKTYPDSLIIITAHYDHLGKMGAAIFPGANDNASGTAMVMELARYFSLEKNQPEMSILFVAFSGEEAGLLGSKYLANHFPFDFKKVQLLINLDMVGTGSEGITIVNATQFPQIFEDFKTINSDHQYLTEVKSRGESCNSDHCPFYEKGMPSIFIYTRGPEATAYHIPQDDYQSLPLTEFEDLFRLIRDYVQQ